MGVLNLDSSHEKEKKKKSSNRKVMVDRFFLSNNPINRHHHHQSEKLKLLSGPTSSGKTSLLFQFAFNAIRNSVACSNPHVVFICNRRRIEANPPYLSQGIDPSCDVFERIVMKYVDDDEGIRKYFAAFHLHETFPAAVIVDDFGDFFNEGICQEKFAGSRGRDMAMVRTLALCHNAIMHANKTGPCELVLSDTHHGEFPRLLYIYKRWVSAVYTIKGDMDGSFHLRNDSVPGRSAKYSTAFQYLMLEGITEEGEE